MPTRGIIFDLDGTLVDSQLDFAAMRDEMGLPPGHAILEAIAELPEPQARRCWEILARHESAGAERATLIPGVAEFLAALGELGLPQAVVTRNCRDSALLTLARLALRFDPVICREDGPIKPDPAAVHAICRRWNVSPAEVTVIGDYVFDIHAGRRAGARTVLFTAGREPHGLAGAEDADFILRTFHEADALLAWLANHT